MIIEPRGPDSDKIIDGSFFRVLSIYHVGTDQVEMRLDIKRNGEQRGFSLFVKIVQPTHGQSMGDPGAPLFIPDKGVVQAAGGFVDRETFIGGLKEFIAKLES